MSQVIWRVLLMAALVEQSFGCQWMLRCREWAWVQTDKQVDSHVLCVSCIRPVCNERISSHARYEPMVVDNNPLSHIGWQPHVLADALAASVCSQAHRYVSYYATACA